MAVSLHSLLHCSLAGPWDYQVCTEFLGQELPYFPAGPQSMFWDQGPFNWDQIEQHCQQTWGVTPTKYWSVTEQGGLDWRCEGGGRQIYGTWAGHPGTPAAANSACTLYVVVEM